jgi:hypothetical protein
MSNLLIKALRRKVKAAISIVDNFEVKFGIGCFVRVQQWSYFVYFVSFKGGKAAMDYYFATCYALGRYVKW